MGYNAYEGAKRQFFFFSLKAWSATLKTSQYQMKNL